MIPMAISYTGIRSGVQRAVMRRVRLVLAAPPILMVFALMIVCDVFATAGCSVSRTSDQVTADDVNNRSFTFANGGVFNTALTNVQTALAFSSNAQNFTLTSAG